MNFPESYGELSPDLRSAVDSVLQISQLLPGLRAVIWGGSTFRRASEDSKDIDLWLLVEKPREAMNDFFRLSSSIPSLKWAHKVGPLRWFGYLLTLFFSEDAGQSVDVGFAGFDDLPELNPGPGFHVVWAEPEADRLIRSSLHSPDYSTTPNVRAGAVLSNLVKIRWALAKGDLWNAFDYLVSARRALMGLIRDTKESAVNYYSRPERGLQAHLSEDENELLEATLSGIESEAIRRAAVQIGKATLDIGSGRLAIPLSKLLLRSVSILAGESHVRPFSVGVVGVGNIGFHLARNLSLTGWDVRVYDVNEDALSRTAEFGARPQLLREIWVDCRVILLCLPSPEVFEQVVSELVIDDRGDRRILVDISTNDPERQAANAQRFESLGHGFVDAPVSGGVWGARDGELTVMAGGTDGDLEVVLPVLKAFARKVIHVGLVGQGNVAKLLHNMVGEVQVQAFAEAFVVGERAGLDRTALFDCLSNGMASSRVLTKLYANGYLAGSGRVNVRLDIAEKDQRLLLNYASRLGVKLTFSPDVHERLVACQELGLGGRDVTETIRWFEKKHCK
jgi:3-hydroxyisobutyrate dehydrogenase-like beta-hydroxyacid dehydrogenase